MPTYDYICDACGHEFEAFEPITSTPQNVCPACKEVKLRRKIGPGAAILFKGSGFYQTDYRSDSYKKAAKADTTSSGGSSSTGGGDSSAKPASPPPAASSSGSNSGPT